MTDIASTLKKASQALKASSTSPRMDAEVLLAHLLQKPRSFLYAHSDFLLDTATHQAFTALIQQRQAGQPIAYLLGYRDFWNLTLKVTDSTLIPRPATETLVEVSLELLKNQPQAKLVDLGTGSGAIALALASERPDWQIKAVDKSSQALAVAKENALLLGIKNVEFYLSDWFLDLPADHYHAIVSNPPYIAEDDPHLHQGDLRFEPQAALISGKEGLDDLNTIIQDAYTRLLPGGYLLLEHGYNQKQAIRAILKQNDFRQIQTWQDCEGNDRISGGQRPVA